MVSGRTRQFTFRETILPIWQDGFSNCKSKLFDPAGNGSVKLNALGRQCVETGSYKCNLCIEVKFHFISFIVPCPSPLFYLEFCYLSSAGSYGNFMVPTGIYTLLAAVPASRIIFHVFKEQIEEIIDGPRRIRWIGQTTNEWKSNLWSLHLRFYFFGLSLKSKNKKIYYASTFIWYWDAPVTFHRNDKRERRFWRYDNSLNFLALRYQGAIDAYGIIRFDIINKSTNFISFQITSVVFFGNFNFHR